MVLYRIRLPILVAFEHQRCSVVCTRIAELVGDVRTTVVDLPARSMVPSAYRANDAIPEFAGTHALLTINALRKKYVRVDFVSLDVKEILNVLTTLLVNLDSAVILALNQLHVVLTHYVRQKITTLCVVVHRH